MLPCVNTCLVYEALKTKVNSQIIACSVDPYWRPAYIHIYLLKPLIFPLSTAWPFSFIYTYLVYGNMSTRRAMSLYSPFSLSDYSKIDVFSLGECDPPLSILFKTGVSNLHQRNKRIILVSVKYRIRFHQMMITLWPTRVKYNSIFHWKYICFLCYII